MLQLFFVILIEINFKHLNQFFAASLQDVTARTSNTAQSRRGFLGKTRSPRRSFHNFHLQRNQAVLLIRRKTVWHPLSVSRLGFSHKSFDEVTKNSVISNEKNTNSAGNIAWRSVDKRKNWRCSTGKDHNYFYSAKNGVYDL